MSRRRPYARAVFLSIALAFSCLVLSACGAESAGGLLDTMTDIYSSVSKKSVLISGDEWYYRHRADFSPDAWAGEAILDLGVPGFSLADLSVSKTYIEPDIVPAGSDRIKSVMALIGPDDVGSDLFCELIQDGMPGYGYNGNYTGIVPGELFIQAPMLLSGGSTRCLATCYAWHAGLDLIFSDLARYLSHDPENRLLYRLTCVYSATDDMPCGFLVEYQSLDGGFSGCKYVYNIQPGIAFDYKTGRNWIAAAGDPEAKADTECEGGDAA